MSNRRLRDWVTYIQNHPTDLQARMEFVNQLPELIDKMNMRDSMVLYRLSRLFAPGTKRQTDLLEQAANMGNTHAMLEIAQQSLSSEKKQLEKALKFLRQIIASGDSFIRDEAQKFLEAYPKVRAVLEGTSSRVSQLGMFQNKQTELEETPVQTPQIPLR